MLKKLPYLFLATLLAFCVAATFYPTGGLLPITGGRATNTAFYGTIEFDTPTSIYGSIYKFYINTNHGPSIDGFNGYARFLGGDPNGFQWISADGTITFMTAGLYGPAGRYEQIIRTPNDQGTILGAFGIDECYGAAVNTVFPYLGGNAGSLAAMPLNGPEIGRRLPNAPAVFYPSDVLQSTNSETENYITNLVQQASVKAIKNVFTNWGIPVWVETEHWMQPTRDASASYGLQTLTAQFPDPIGWVCNYCHTNGFGLELHIDWSTRIANGVSGTYPFAYQCMTPQTINRDIVYFYTNGIDAIRVGDGISGDIQSGAGFVHMQQRDIADKLLFPNGKLWSTQAGYTNPIVFDCFIYDPLRVGLVIDSPYMVNNFADDQGRGGSGANDISRALYQMRLTWTNYAPYASKGHYFSSVYVDDQYKSVPDFQALLAAQAIYPGPLSFFSNSIHGTFGPIWTNNLWLRAFTDVAQEPGFPVYDAGTNGGSAWFKPCAGGSFYFLFANETGSSSNMTVNWSQLVSPKSFAPVGTTLYPITVGTNSPFQVTEVWATNNLGIFNGTFTQTITAHNTGFYRFDPIGNQSLLINTNFISGVIYTNLYGNSIMALANATITEASVAGNASLSLRMAGNNTNMFGEQTISGTLVTSKTNVLSGIVTNRGTYTFTNTSSGAGNSAAVQGGQIFVY